MTDRAISMRTQHITHTRSIRCMCYQGRESEVRNESVSLRTRLILPRNVATRCAHVADTQANAAGWARRASGAGSGRTGGRVDYWLGFQRWGVTWL